MEAYFKARRTCDINGLAEVYGDSASPEELREEGLRMEEEVKYYQSYNDIACYSVNGPEENTLVVYTRFQICLLYTSSLLTTTISRITIKTAMR